MNAKPGFVAALSALTASVALAACGGGASVGASKAPPPSAPADEPSSQEVRSSQSGGYGSADGPAAGAPLPAPAPAQPSAKAEASPADASARRTPLTLEPVPQERPGLATQWGESRSSRVTTAPFQRAESLNPFAVAKLFYNDPQGINAMSDRFGAEIVRRHLFPVGEGFVEVGLRDGDSRRFLSGFSLRGESYVAGQSGRRYTIVVRNHSPGRVEAVVSVDGLDVIDGKAAGFGKRGYLLDPHDEVEIQGFRTSMSAVAAFRFGAVRDSYAEKKHGDTRNVGVIGVALFHEHGDSPSRWGQAPSQDEVLRRQNANPFPGQFATPPR
jgi:hypothetical protein